MRCGSRICDASSTMARSKPLSPNSSVCALNAVTVIGHDNVGVIARVSGLCAELHINVEDVTQSILQGMFAMIMLVDISNCNVSHEELHKRTDTLPPNCLTK